MFRGNAARWYAVYRILLKKLKGHTPRRYRLVPGKYNRVFAFLRACLLCRTKGGKLGTDKMPEKEKRHGIHKG